MILFNLAFGSIANPPRASAAVQPFGVSSLATLIGGDQDVYLSDAWAINNVKASWVRVLVPWNNLEPRSQQYNWAIVDKAIYAAVAYGLNILLNVIGPAPAWAQPPGRNPTASNVPPGNPDTFGRAAGAIANRYKTWVNNYEIWNEPNTVEYFSPVNVSTFGGVLRSAYMNIKAVQPNATVMIGGLSPTATGGLQPPEFMRQLYQLGGRPYFDAVGLHPYTFPYKITEDPMARVLIVPNVYDLMVSNGDSNKKIWITEFGQATGTSSVAVSQQQQADILVDFLERASVVPFLGPSFLFTTRNLSPNTAVPDANYGLYDMSFNPKLAVNAIRALNP